MFGGSIYGFLGILLAIPVAATLGVLLRFLVTKYLESSIYYGRSKNKDES
jgi:predicted PurR-regulated permease PerM